MFKIKKKAKKVIEEEKQERLKSVEEVEAPTVDPEVETKVNELAEFVRIADKWGIHRMRHAYHMLRDAEKLLKEQSK